MKLLLLLLAISTAVKAAKIVCYYQSWAIYYEEGGAAAVHPEDLDPNMCTHYNYAFVRFNNDGTLKIADDWADIDKQGYQKLVALKQQNSALKVLLSLGGGSAPADVLSTIAADPQKRATMIQSAHSFMDMYGFDGIDMDWEWPQQADRENFVTLLQEMKNDFAPNGWLVTAAVSAIPHEGLDVPSLNQVLDFFNIMDYDFYGPWSPYTGQNAALYPAEIETDREKARCNDAASIDAWLDAGASPEKIIIGLGFYGRSFTLEDPGNNGLHAPFVAPGEPGALSDEEGYLGYNEFCSEASEWDCQWNDEQRVPICLKGDQWLGIDNQQSILEKVNYFKAKGIGGAMVWPIDQDDVYGICGEKWPLLKTVYNNL